MAAVLCILNKLVTCHHPRSPVYPINWKCGIPRPVTRPELPHSCSLIAPPGRVTGEFLIPTTIYPNGRFPNDNGLPTTVAQILQPPIKMALLNHLPNGFSVLSRHIGLSPSNIRSHGKSPNECRRSRAAGSHRQIHLAVVERRRSEKAHIMADMYLGCSDHRRFR